MRRLVIFLTLIILIGASYQLSQLAQGWHHVVSGAPGELVYVSTFDGFIEDWEQYDERNTAKIEDGRLQVYLAAEGRIVYSAARPYFQNFDLTVEASAVEGSEDNAFGVIFRQRDRNNLYAFLISSNGYYTVERTVNGSAKPLSQWHPSPAIQTGMNAVNRLRVVGFGNQFQFFINGQQIELCVPNNPNAISTVGVQGECMEGEWVTTLTDDSLRYGRVALGVKADPAIDVTVAFDNLVVYEPLPF
ncbi:MAG: hypothetical protein SF029_23330 [bacterium]|nr:hypothetical protein [bacterium]